MSDNTPNDTKQSENSEGNESKTELVDDLKQQVSAMKNKMQELLSETKAAKTKARDEADAKEQAKLERAKKDGDFEKLLKSSEGEREKLSQELNGLRSKVNSEKIGNQSMKLATELADGPNAEILSEFISRRLQMAEDGIRVLDSTGNLTVSSLEDLKSEFQRDIKYKALIRGTKASGGGSQGSGNSVANSKSVTREAFSNMNPTQQMKHVKDGGHVTEN